MRTAQVAIFFCVLTKALANDLRCYDCNPEDGTCSDPVQRNSKITACTSLLDKKGIINTLQKEIDDIDKIDLEPRSGGEMEYECFSMHYKADDEYESRSGVYRGCVEKTQEISSACDYLKEKLIKGNLTNCLTCNENSCNVHDVGGAAGLTVSFAVLIFNLILIKMFTL